MKRLLKRVLNWWNRMSIAQQKINELEGQLARTQEKLLMRDSHLIMASINYSALKQEVKDLNEQLAVKELHIELLKSKL